jgi:uncharacterized membrane protein
MKSWLIGFGASLAALAVLDGLWLGLIARDFYKARLGGLLRETPVWSVAVLFYVVHAAGVATFVLPQAASWTSALLLGGFFGFCAYAAYDFTNHATLRDWPPIVTTVDLAWGSAATAATALVAYFCVRGAGAGG